MAIRIKWDQYETALLIETFWEIEAAPDNKASYIKKLSDNLRQMAINRGIEIDETYRNVNGISMQLSSIAHGFFPDRPTLTSSAMFEKMVKMYKEDKCMYKEILSDAHRLIGDDSEVGEDNNKPFKKWLDNKELKRFTSEKILETLNQMSDYCYRHELISCPICELDDSKVFLSAMYKMLSKRNFKKYFKEDIKFVKRAIALYNAFLLNKESGEINTVVMPEIINDNSEETLDINSERSVITQILDSHFSYGFNYNSPIELMRFRKNYFNDVGKEFIYDANCLVGLIKEVGVEYSGKIYIIKKEAIDKLKDIICRQIESGRTIFYYEPIFSANESWLFEERIVSDDMLKIILMNEFVDFQYKPSFFLTQQDRCTEKDALIRDIDFVWGDKNLRTFDELSQELIYVPISKIKYALTVGDEFVWNSFETYTRIDCFIITDEQKEDMELKAASLCDEKGSAFLEEIISSDVFDENYELSETALYDLAFRCISDQFSRNGKVITRKGENNDITAEIIRYCRSKDTCTIDELNQLMMDLTGGIRYPVVIEVANSVKVRVDKDLFVDDSQVSFDIEKIDDVLNDMVKGNVVGIKEFSSFATLPYCGFSWNHFILESYCRRFSRLFKYACITPNSKNAGAIIRKDCDHSYHELMAEAVARESINLNEKDIFDYLISSGLMLKKSYNNMDGLIQRASEIREGR